MMACRAGARRWARWVVAVILAVAALHAGSSTAQACSICGCGDPLLAAADPAAIAGQLRLQLDTEYLRIDAGTEGQPGYTDKLTQWSYRLNVVYRPWTRLSLIATLPLVDKTMRTVGGGLDVVDSHLTGLGDAELAARLVLWQSLSFVRRRVQEVALSAGTMMPTGRADAATTDSSGQRVPTDPHAQLGTGGWGPFVGLHDRFEQGDGLLFADLAYRWRTTGTYFDGSTYKFGDALLWSLHGQYRVHTRVAADLGVDGRYARPDKAAAAGQATSTVVNTGGTLLALAPGVYVNALPQVWLFGRAQFPFYKRLYGEQDVGPSVVLGLQYEAL
jgi:hypothetical protein